VRRFPADAHPNNAFHSLACEFHLSPDSPESPGLFYLDAAPVRTDRQLVITSPTVASQIVKTAKHPCVASLFGGVLGRRTLALSNGPSWKAMRTVFAPAFAPSHLFSLMPSILEETELFVSCLKTASVHDQGYVPHMGDMLKRLSFDLVCRLVVGRRMQSQVTECELADLMHAAAWWPNPGSLNPLEGVNVVRMAAFRYYEWRIKGLVDAVVLGRWEQVRMELGAEEGGKKSESKVIIDMALKAYCEDGQLDAKTTKGLPGDILDILSDK
jgi:cytochrome P450